MADYSKSLINSLIKNVKEYPRFSKEEIEKFCWMAVHEYKHGVLPSEYDIREIDEKLYLQLLEELKLNKYFCFESFLLLSIFFSPYPRIFELHLP